MIAAAAPWLIHSQPNDWVTWKESQLNSIPRRAWTKAAASSLAGSYHRGQGIITSFSDLTGILRQAGIPFKEALYDGDEPVWTAATTRPDLFLHEEWAVAITPAIPWRQPFKEHRSRLALTIIWHKRLK